MYEDIGSRFPLLQLFENEDTPYALADPDEKIVWFNSQFKNTVGNQRLKGKKISSIFTNLKIDLLDNSNAKQAFTLFIPEIPGKLTVTPFYQRNIINGFFLKVEKEPDEIDPSQKNLLFQQELKDILTLLVKENPLEVLADEVLLRCATISKSVFGITILHIENNKNQFLYYDPSSQFNNKQDIEKEIKINLSYIIKWLEVNKKSLIAANHPSNIGYSLVKALESRSLILSPCIFENKHLATIIVGKKEDGYSTHDINSIEQFAALLAFVISSIKTRELNTALENRLLQSQKLETIGKLSSGMAHDFSNLLSSIFGSINLLKKRVPQHEDIMRLLDNIENCSVRAKDLTKGLLSFGKPTSKRKELIKPNILLSEISKVVTQTFPKNISFDQHVSDKLYDILGNATEIYQVLLNLCVNAKEAIEDSGTITLKANNLTVNEKNRIEYPVLSKGNYVHFSVQDTGTGIAEDNLQKIFDPYFSTKSKETGSGSGLGLYVTYGIIKAHNGHIEVTSEKDSGTRFDVFIPSYEPAAFKSSSPEEKIILLADDELMLRDLLGELLESNGYNVIKVSSGTEALRVLTEEIKADLLIIDYNMPGMNGLEAIKKIRGLNFEMPVLLSSGVENLSDSLDLKELGVTDILTKPYEFDTMLTRIQQLI